ncbi:glucosylglycerate hydrolase [Saccharomonospora glauca]|uniref:Glycogen debranching enzyme n=1 Tax=Saccharomonospora glauca K62 TaxID=928724 RepID=I1D6Y8_9PSEU|nr:glycoside hydrolase 100 family protein [Saccharomonospora glauca]EIF00713.1 glycogen debranching enzyme [Saccharomonospora glauca K62]
MTTTTTGTGPTGLSDTTLAARAAAVLRDNDTGALVTASPKLYPHMWSWDAAFIAIGLAYLDVGRALTELDTLLSAQWSDGMLPHIVFTDAEGYFPGPDRWGTDIAPQRPRRVRTSGICQPPVHAVALRRIVSIARRTSKAEAELAERFTARAWSSLYRWHAWLARHRIAEPCGLLTIVHGWESGMDNSPRWDAAYERVRPGPDLPPYVRLDTLGVDDPGERPSDEEYNRYLWLIEQMRRVRYEPARVLATSDFRVGDVFSTALFAMACDDLAELAEELSLPVSAEVAELRSWARRSRRAVADASDPDTGLAFDRDLRSGETLRATTVASFAPLLCSALPKSSEARLLANLTGPGWAGHPDLVAAVPPSVSPREAGFDSRRYWRGPQWPVVVWLFSFAFLRNGHTELARRWREEGLRLVSDGSFGEYYEPFTGEPLGSTQQSWTAAVTLDWLCGW